MAKIVLFLALVSAVGCGGPSFTAAGVDEADGGHTADALAASGGAQTVVGRQPDSGTGGMAPDGSGGSSGSGSGGAVSIDGGHDPSTALDSGDAPSDACTLVTHSNGVGQTWQDCVPRGTYNEVQAKKACEAWCAAQGGCVGECNSGGIFCHPSDTPTHYTVGAVIAPPDAGYVGVATIVGWSLEPANLGSTVSVSPESALSCTQVGTWN